MCRSSWKLPYICLNLQSRIVNNPQCLNIFERSSTITPEFIGKTVNVHNGLKNVPVVINENLVGFKFGQFTLTRKRLITKKKRKKNVKT